MLSVILFLVHAVSLLRFRSIFILLSRGGHRYLFDLSRGVLFFSAFSLFFRDVHLRSLLFRHAFSVNRLRLLSLSVLFSGWLIAFPVFTHARRHATGFPPVSLHFSLFHASAHFTIAALSFACLTLICLFVFHSGGAEVLRASQ